jgi:hypothetical protein
MTPEQPDSSTPQAETKELSQSQIDQTASTTNSTEQTEGLRWYGRIFVAWFYLGIALTVAWFVRKDFVKSYWIPIAVVFGVLAILVSIPSSSRWIRRGTAQRRIGVIIFGLVPLIVLFFFLVFSIDPKYQTALLRTIFLIVVCSLPALLYYLFIATKKSSLLNEFIINLNRLGLRDPKRVPAELCFAGLDHESEGDRRDRIYTYIQKFEAVYGAVPTNLGAMLLDPANPGSNVQDLRSTKSDLSGLSNIFTVDTTIPVIVATVLLVLGWLITLPPWQGRLEFGKQSTQTATEVQSKQSSLPQVQQTQSVPAQNTVASQSGSDAASQQPTPTPTPTPAPIDPSTEKWLAVYTPISSPVRFAFLGAYFFALQLLFRRYVRRDLRASAYVAVSLRVILAVIGIWVVVEAVAMAPQSFISSDTQKHSVDKFLLVLGFVIGVFPRVAWQVIQSGIKRVGSIIVPSLETQMPLRDLDGLTVWHEARFEEEDIENIPNMATADLVDLLINTRFPADRIIDWVDQAILYTHLGPEPTEPQKTDMRTQLANHGIRNATSLVETYNSSQFHEDRDEFEKIIPTNGRNTMRSLVDVVGTNPNLKLIQTWKGLLPHIHPARSHSET